MAGRGRPTKYTEALAEQAVKIALLGHSDEQIADCIGVTETTLNNWKIKHQTFFESIKKAKYDSDLEVEKTLRQRALGYEHNDVKIFNDQGAPLIVPYKKHVQPDTTAQIFWLKNRQPDRWRDKQEIKQDIELTTVVADFGDATDDL